MTLKQENLILSLIGSDPNGFKPIEIHKILFMLGKFDSSANIYEFVPYRKGAYSPTLAHDLLKLEYKGYIKQIVESNEENIWQLTSKGEERSFAARTSARRVIQFRHLYPLRGRELVVDVYKRYPYWAVNSEISDLLLRDDIEALKKITQAKPKRNISFASIGYEGRSVEDYFNKLICAGITILCDVRKNPISRKYGFSKSTLNEFCQGCRIEYRHYPQLGIPSVERQNLKCQNDYDELFEKYEKEVLSVAQKEIEEIAEMISNGKRVAVTCFENNPDQCHRTRVADAITRKIGVKAQVI